MKRPLAVAALAATALTLAACGADSASEEETTLRVGAAASLAEPFEELAEIYEAENRGTTVELQFAGSSTLAAQIRGGADFDVFASANEANMDKVTDSIAGESTPFATNTLTIVTEPGNPQGISGLADLEDDSLAVVVCAEQVPCGAATKELTEQQGVTLTPASEESQVTDVLAKVTSGEADAGLVYATDATTAGDDVTTVPVDGSDEVVNTYPIAVLTGASSDEAQAFVELVTGTQGQRVLGDHGFGAP